MADQLFEQGYLNFGIQDQYRLIHGGHNDHVAVCTKDPAIIKGTQFKQKVYAHDQALYAEMELVSNHDIDVYQSQAGISEEGHRRNSRAEPYINSITHFWVDMDVYKIEELKDIDADSLLDLVRDKFPWLPTPTVTISSGKGYYLHWSFGKRIDKKKFSKWSQVMEVLTQILVPLGADLACRDKARVLRVAQSYNTKNGEMVTGAQTGSHVSFTKFSSLVLKHGSAHLDEQLTKQGRVKTEIVHNNAKKSISIIEDTSGPFFNPDNSDKQSKNPKIKNFLTWREQAEKRMADFHTLAMLRGSPGMDDYRSRLLVQFAMAGTYHWSSLEQARREIRGFADMHFKEPHKYTDSIAGTMLQAMRKHWKGEVRIWEGQTKNARYYIKTENIIRDLNITLEEQRQLQTIITKPVKDERAEQCRRDRGIQPRSEYTQQADKRREQARELSERYYWSQTDIAIELQCSQQEISRLLIPACG